MSSEGPIKPGDQVMVTLQLPKQIEPLAVERTTVRWAKNDVWIGIHAPNVYGCVAPQKIYRVHAMPSL